MKRKPSAHYPSTKGRRGYAKRFSNEVKRKPSAHYPSILSAHQMAHEMRQEMQARSIPQAISIVRSLKGTKGRKGLCEEVSEASQHIRDSSLRSE